MPDRWTRPRKNVSPVSGLALLCLSAGLQASGTVHASAADLPPVVGERVLAAPRAPFAWDGFTAGVLAGYALSTADLPGPVAIDGRAGTGGAYLGYNFQVDGVVIGLEADVMVTSFSQTDGTVSVDQLWQSTVRGRLGAAFDRFQVYGTGGVAFNQLDVTVGGSTDRVTQIGYALGAGLENQMSHGLTTRVEYLYTGFGSEALGFAAPNTSVQFDSHTLRAGLGLRF